MAGVDKHKYSAGCLSDCLGTRLLFPLFHSRSVSCRATSRRGKNSLALARPHHLFEEHVRSHVYEWKDIQLKRWLATNQNLIQHVRKSSFCFLMRLPFLLWDLVLGSATHAEKLILKVSHTRAFDAETKRTWFTPHHAS